MEEIRIEQYLLMDYTSYKEIMIENMIKNQRNAIDITLLPHDKLKGQTVEEIVEDINRLINESKDF
jgi:hypothetical protein